MIIIIPNLGDFKKQRIELKYQIIIVHKPGAGYSKSKDYSGEKSTD